MTQEYNGRLYNNNSTWNAVDFTEKFIEVFIILNEWSFDISLTFLMVFNISPQAYKAVVNDATIFKLELPMKQKGWVTAAFWASVDSPFKWDAQNNLHLTNRHIYS